MTEPARGTHPKLLTIRDLQELLRCGRTTAYARVHEPAFPVPVVLSGSAHRWWEHEVLAWIESCREPEARRRGKTSRRDSASRADGTTPAKSTPPTPTAIRRRQTHGRQDA